MGRPKPLLPWRGATLVEHQVTCLLEGGCDEVVVVLGHAADEVAPLVRGESVRAVVNPDYRQGKTTSIKTGLAHADPSATAIVLLAVDQPRTAAIVREVVRAHLTGGRTDNLAALRGTRRPSSRVRCRTAPRTGADFRGEAGHPRGVPGTPRRRAGNAAGRPHDQAGPQHPRGISGRLHPVGNNQQLTGKVDWGASPSPSE